MSEYIISILFFCFGVFFKYHASFLAQGTIDSMGPGYYPDMIATILIGVALVIALRKILWKS
jgi:hypothetical protein